MELTAAQQRYFAYWLTRSLPSDSLGKLTASLQNAQVDLTPHQIDSQFWAEHRRHLLIIAPANLRNVYKPANKISNTIKNALADRKKMMF